MRRGAGFADQHRPASPRPQNRTNARMSWSTGVADIGPFAHVSKSEHGTKKLGVTNSKCGVANQKWADVRSTKSGDNGGQHDKRPEVDNQNDIETQSDRDASLRRALLGLQLETERLKGSRRHVDEYCSG